MEAPATEGSFEALLGVPMLEGAPGIRAFARRVDALSRSSEVIAATWQRAVNALEASGRSITTTFPDFEAITVRWGSFVDDVRGFFDEALVWFRTETREAIAHFNQLVRELNEWLGFAQTWTELRELALREIRSLRSGPTLSERLEVAERSFGVTLGLLTAAGVVGLGAYAWFEWKKAEAASDLFEVLGGRA